jgi:hypothetical protein
MTERHARLIVESARMINITADLSHRYIPDAESGETTCGVIVARWQDFTAAAVHAVRNLSEATTGQILDAILSARYDALGSDIVVY